MAKGNILLMCDMLAMLVLPKLMLEVEDVDELAVYVSGARLCL
jgi:hypothetical protein